jgi:ABC-type amino acid transport substrate-binding protein
MNKNRTYIFIGLLICLFVCQEIIARDLPDIIDSGQLRHLGIPYANFNTGSGDGLDTEVMQRFARHLGVRYTYVKSDWKEIIPSVTGKVVDVKDPNMPVIGKVSQSGDIIATGMTILPWRTKLLNYSIPTFPTQVWLVARSDSSMKPIKPSGDIKKDILQVKKYLKGRTVLGKLNTCLDPSIYQLEKTGANIKLFDGKLTELAPAIITDEAEATILDVPDALIALEKWPGKIKVIGPISAPQKMGVAFPKDAPKLQSAFDRFFREMWNNGSYFKLVKKYYPTVFTYYPKFFVNNKKEKKARKDQ